MIKTRLIDLAVVIALGYFQYYLLQYHLDFLFLDFMEKHRWLAVALSMTPLFALYFFSRVLLPSVAAGTLTAGATFLLTKVSNTKQALTTAPLSWTDLSQTDNWSIIPHYISYHHILYVLLAVGVIFVLTRIDPSKRLKKSGILLGALFSVISLHPYLDKIDNHVSRVARFELIRQDVQYYMWDWPLNIRKNGLLTHLIQTSQRRIPSPPSTEERSEFDLLTSSEITTVEQPANIILILCEACWHDDQHFKSAFKPLTDIGFQPFRAISPVYGGGTVNSAFELLTGLPANGALNGVIYQEYTQLLSSKAWAWPRNLQLAGYTTTSLHNFSRNFWNRHIINPKLGFQQFISIEDMNYDGPTLARDYILFDAAVEDFQNKNGSHFQFMTTLYTHGGYESHEGDDGEHIYGERLAQSLQEAADFASKLIESHPDTLILLVGDHKPALTRFFHQANVFPDDFFIRTGLTANDYMFAPSAPKEVLGDVPGYIYYRNQDLTDRLNQQPFFCLTQIINDATVGTVLPSFQYSRHHSLCSKNTTLPYTQLSESYPSWLYSASLFQP